MVAVPGMSIKAATSGSFYGSVAGLAEAWPGSSKPRAEDFLSTMEKLSDTLFIMNLQTVQEKSI
jgi:hypothetical protein